MSTETAPEVPAPQDTNKAGDLVKNHGTHIAWLVLGIIAILSLPTGIFYIPFFFVGIARTIYQLKELPKLNMVLFNSAGRAEARYQSRRYDGINIGDTVARSSMNRGMDKLGNALFSRLIGVALSGFIWPFREVWSQGRFLMSVARGG